MRSSVPRSGCSPGNESRGLDRMPDPFTRKSSREAQEPLQLRSVYILDEESIVCLRGLIESCVGSYDPARFDLYESCSR